MIKEHMDGVINKVMEEALEAYQETYSSEAAFDIVFRFLQKQFRIYTKKLITKSEYNYYRNNLEKLLIINF